MNFPPAIPAIDLCNKHWLSFSESPSLPAGFGMVFFFFAMKDDICLFFHRIMASECPDVSLAPGLDGIGSRDAPTAI